MITLATCKHYVQLYTLLNFYNSLKQSETTTYHYIMTTTSVCHGRRLPPSFKFVCYKRAFISFIEIMNFTMSVIVV